MMPKILCAGLIAADLVFEMDGFPEKGIKNKAKASRLITGGGALNAASAIASLGGDVSLLGSIGDDEFGQFLRQKMKERNIDDRLVQTLDGVGTSRSANVITPDGDRTIINQRDAALLSGPLNVPPDFAFDAALIDTRWPAAALQIVETARRANKPVVVDAEAPVSPAQDALVGATHVIFSEQGLADFTGGADANALKQAGARLGGWCAVTRGPLPVLCFDQRSLTDVPAYQTHALNTLGAGDVWHGAFTLALAKGLPELTCVQWANAVAALKVSRAFHVEELPTLSEVETWLKASDSLHR